MRQVLFVTATLCLTIVADQVPATPNPEPCCTPKQFEVKVGESISEEYGKTMNINMPRVSMDFTRNMSSIVEEISGEGTVKAIMDYSKQLIYVIMNEDDKLVCRKTKLPPVEMAFQCLPKNSRFLGKTRMGYGKQSLDCNTWLMERNMENPPTHQQMYLVFQSGGCVPIVEQIITKISDTTVTEGASYYDFTPGIKDASVFTIPSICDQAKPGDLSGLSNTANSMIRKFRK